MQGRRAGAAIAAVVAGLLAVLPPTGAAAATGTEVLASDTWMGAFAVRGSTLSLAICSTVEVKPADGSVTTLPWPACSAHMESSSGIADATHGSGYALSTTFHPPMGQVQSVVAIPTTGGARRVDVSSYEFSRNPDRRQTYGVARPDACVRRTLGPDASYAGVSDSAVPSVAAAPDGSWVTADRQGNTIYRIGASGKLSVLAVLPPVSVTVDAATASGNGWPSCMVGKRVSFEAAPSEVEVGPDGTVYAAGLPTLLPYATARQSVIYEIDPRTKQVRVAPQHFPGPVDLAIGRRGAVFVAVRDQGRIVQLVAAKSRTYAVLPRVQSVETDPQARLYAATTPGDDPGAIVRFG